ncbi:MAG: AAA family ATPase [Alphaproteobacteria bacterium]|nr:AAA family ATPase [Alphaproteobacteria bacterium]
MASSQRPQEIPYEPQSIYALLIYGIRLIFQLWPLWMLYFLADNVSALWFNSAHAMGDNAVLYWLLPFVPVFFALALWPLTFMLKRMSLANWTTVDAASAGILLVTLSSTWDVIVKYKGMSIAQIMESNYTQSLAMLGFAILLLSFAFKSSLEEWASNLISSDHQDTPDHPSAPVIKGEVKAPPAAGLREIDADKLAASLQRRVIGQDIISTQLAKAVARRLAQQRRGKPVFTGLFAGPTGVGKTEMAKAVATSLLGSDKTLFRVDCGNILGEAGLQTLIGAPTGYMGSDKPGALTAHVQRFPNSVILFDEIEKAMGQQGQQSPLFRLLLSMLDEGRFTEQSTGATIDATGCVIIMTSNAAHKALGAIYEQHKEDPTALTRATKDELQSYFAPEFLARIDLVTSFSPLDAAARGRVLSQHIARIAKQYEVTVASIDAALVNQGLVQWQALETYGAREVLRWLEDAISDPLIDAKKAGIKTVDLVWKNGAAKAIPATKLPK